MNKVFTEKRRIVAILHFALSLFLGFRMLAGFSLPPEKIIFFFIQPPSWIFFGNHQLNWLEKAFSLIPIWITVLAWLATVPIWSLCFGWIFAKLDNWLNHFPFLGKRVF